MLQDQLRRVARTMEKEARSTPALSHVWNVLAEHVDEPHFERTGQILTPLLPTTAFTLDGASITAEEAEAALRSLMESGHIATARRSGDQPCYRLILPQTGHESPEGQRE